MNVHEESVRGPPSLLSDFVPVNVIEVHGHGSARSEGMTANGSGWETFFVQAQQGDGRFD